MIFPYVIFFVVAAGALSYVLPHDLAYFIFKENGPVESLQAILYVAAALVAWLYARRRIWTSGYGGGLIFLVFAMRELDFQRMFADISITRTKFYFSPEVSVWPKILSALILAGIAVVSVNFIRKNWSVFVEKVKRRERGAVAVLTALILIPAANLTDASFRLLKPFGYRPDAYASVLKMALEEAIELAIPALFLYALLLHGKKIRGK